MRRGSEIHYPASIPSTTFAVISRLSTAAIHDQAAVVIQFNEGISIVVITVSLNHGAQTEIVNTIPDFDPPGMIERLDHGGYVAALLKHFPLSATDHLPLTLGHLPHCATACSTHAA